MTDFPPSVTFGHGSSYYSRSSHHVTQRGNGRVQTFFSDTDYSHYLDLLAASCREGSVAVWSWVLMPNHVHLVLVPEDEDGLRRILARVHRAYAGHVHSREKGTGHFWQGRFGAVAMDETHFFAALRYIALNPVRARLVDRPEAWRGSSVRAHLSGEDDGISAIAPVRELCQDFSVFLGVQSEEGAIERLRKAESIGRPLGDDAFLDRLEALTGRTLKPAKPRRKTKRNIAN